ncbi:MAG TPA: recombinase family protein [Gemmatimonadaceae bacterium]|nr:recombinase family protein [Gemmatimonadaceae bacterium]
MVIGYARVSTLDQSHALQLDALNAAGCERVFTDTASGTKGKDERPALAEALTFARPGDVLCVWRLDRLGRSVSHLIEMAAELRERDVELRSLTEQIDTSSATGKLIFHVLACLGEFEAGLIRERTLAGLAIARKEGRVGGRPRLMTPAKIAAALVMRDAGASSIEDICTALSVSRATLYRALRDGATS